jgi:hypothetical protein
LDSKATMPLLRSVLLLALLRLPAHASAQQQQQPDISPSCDSEDELLESLRYLRTICSQEGVEFPDGRTPVPAAIETPGCARAARRVSSECGGLLGSSSWFASRKQALDIAVDSAANVPDAPPRTHHLADPGMTAIHSCGAVLDDGFELFPSIGSGQSRVAIDVGPSRGSLRIDFDELTLDAKNNDNLRVYTDADENEELRVILPGDLPLTEPIEVAGSTAVLLLVSDGASTRTSLVATVSCVCEDSESFVDERGEGCASYGEGGGGEKHLRCTSLLPPADARARAACPAACGACTPGPCAVSPCKNGGRCTEVAGGGGGGGGHRRLQGGDGYGTGEVCTTADELSARSDAVNAECCDEPTEDCSNGAPNSCNSGCAALLVPYYHDCEAALQQATGGAELLSLIRSTVLLCDASSSLPSYECECVGGYVGHNCDEDPCHGAVPYDCGAHGECATGFINMQWAAPTCTCDDGWRGDRCDMQ